MQNTTVRSLKLHNDQWEVIDQAAEKAQKKNPKATPHGLIVATLKKNFPVKKVK
jgi:hypothetical protein